MSTPSKILQFRSHTAIPDATNSSPMPQRQALLRFVSGTPTIVEGNVPVSDSIRDFGQIVGGVFTGRMDQIVRESPSLGRIDIGDLYPEMLGIRPELTAALDLLAESLRGPE